MNGDGRFYLACAVMLLALPGCTHGSSVAVLANDSYAMAVPNDDPSPGERDFREADFGLDDPGVTVITADKGGSIPSMRGNFLEREPTIRAGSSMAIATRPAPWSW